MSVTHDVETTLNYYDDPGDGSEPTPVVIGQGTVTNERKMAQVAVTVHDITGEEDSFTLDIHGFRLVRDRPTTATACLADHFEDITLIKNDYFEDCVTLLKDATGASRAFVFDHKVRRGPSDWHKLGAGNASQRGPLHRVHVDQSYDGAAFLVKWYLPEEAGALLQKRWQIINAWRPINTVYKDPLAVADAKSVDDSDLVEARVIYRDHERRTWTITSSSKHRWHYKNAQTPDEVMLIKCFDSIADGTVARRVPHSAFHDPKHDDAPPRESIEIRAFVFFDE
ncbi:hypothetical protein SEUCBS140593_008507 [Sporothrix eucalyptigena]|uniref:Methyltransferase n=1 Tax=Sporothrix eucalyptigena TaxID=1812306 RepID=A0ABP0CM21_9PEZI